MATSSFTTHSPPDVSSNDHIVAICTVGQHHCKQEALAGHVADFLAFKHLLSRSVPDHHQVWLSACDPRSLDVLRHGTKDVLGAFDEKLALEQDPRLLMRQFKLSLQQSTSTIWSLGGGKLVILVCGPTSTRQDIIEHIPEDFEHGAPEFCMITDIAEVVGGNVNSILVSPSMYTGGWVVNTSLTKGPSHLTSFSERSNHIRLRLARNCAPLFVSQAFTMLTAESSPLRLRPIPNSSLSMLTRNNTGRPEAEDACKRLQNAVSESCYSLISCAPRCHVFNFAPGLDNGAHLVAPRSGATLGELHDRWTELPDHREKPQSNRLYPYYTFGNRKKSQALHLKLLAWTVLHSKQSCFDDRFLAILDTLLDDNSPGDTLLRGRESHMCKQIVYSLVYHDAARNLAEYFVWFIRTTQVAAKLRQSHDKLGAPAKKSFLERLKIALLEVLTPDRAEREANPALDTLPTCSVEWMAEHILDSLMGRRQRAVSPEEHFQFILKQLAHVTQNLSSLVIKELLTSPWVASAGYGLLMTIKKEPDSERLFMGRLTGVASGHGAPPSEFVPIKPRSMQIRSTGYCTEDEIGPVRDSLYQQSNRVKGNAEQRPASKLPEDRKRSEAGQERSSKNCSRRESQRGSSATASSGKAASKASDIVEGARAKTSPAESDLLTVFAPSHLPTRLPTSSKASSAHASPGLNKKRTHKHFGTRSKVSAKPPPRCKLQWGEGAGDGSYQPFGVADTDSGGTGAPLDDSEEDLIDFSLDLSESSVTPRS